MNSSLLRKCSLNPLIVLMQSVSNKGHKYTYLSVPNWDKVSSSFNAMSNKEEHAASKGSVFAAAMMSSSFYSLCSIATVIANKYVSFGMPNDVREQIPDLAVILIQCFIAVVLVEFARLMRWVEYEPFNLETAKAWMPVNILFIGMLCSGFISFVYVSVPMITIFKNLTNLVTVAGDWYLFKER